ncbi:MAG TPA: zinc-ribbon and DUF3426 domain-containing protein [Gammaproteobacteria bacterium]|nr:zinc-ribbon and DUF3426 domain-containing protein [Gammaproteobacteria bacterium]
MNTRCPDCKTLFRVTKAQLAQADGQVRCGQCGCIFSGFIQLVADKPDKRAVKADKRDAKTPVSPDFFKRMLLARSGGVGKWARVGWSLGAALLSLALLLQLAYIERERLLRHERIGPYIADWCQRIPRCVLPPARDSGRIQLVSRSVYSHPNINGVLIVNAVITNSAAFSQPYPVLLISMSNRRGQVIAERYFKPEEYLIMEAVDSSGMEPGKSVPVTLAVMDPGQDAMAFEIDFL